MFDLNAITGFDWDKGNKQKNWEKHGVDFHSSALLTEGRTQSVAERNKRTFLECEEVFFNRPLMVGDDSKYSIQENRYFVLGRSNAGRTLFLVITVRSDRVRVISARDQSRKERQVYEQRP